MLQKCGSCGSEWSSHLPKVTQLVNVESEFTPGQCESITRSNRYPAPFPQCSECGPPAHGTLCGGNDEVLLTSLFTESGTKPPVRFSAAPQGIHLGSNKAREELGPCSLGLCPCPPRAAVTAHGRNAGPYLSLGERSESPFVMVFSVPSLEPCDEASQKFKDRKGYSSEGIPSLLRRR